MQAQLSQKINMVESWNRWKKTTLLHKTFQTFGYKVVLLTPCYHPSSISVPNYLAKMECPKLPLKTW